jgi:hypothetical protein
MDRYYRAVRETPGLIEGAILRGLEGQPYRVIDPLFVRFEGLCDSVINRITIENNPDWFEQVWEVDGVYYNDLVTAQAAALAKITVKESK